MSQPNPSVAVPPAPHEPKTWLEWLAWVATEDHCEWANRYVACLKTPLGILLVGAVCSLLCGLFVAPQGYVLLVAITAVIAIGLVWPFVVIRGVSCRVAFEARRGREGKASAAKLVVTNRWPWPVWGLAVNDPLLADEADAPLALARVAGWSTATFNCSLTPSRRGVYPRREVRLGTGFPFGLYEASRAAQTPRRLVVWPQTFWLPPLGISASRSHWRGAVTDGRAGSEGTRLGTRDHRPGDSLRDVHWSKTARYDRLIVCEREAVTAEDIAVIVDVDPANHAGAGGDSTLEWSLRIAASICESVAANQGTVELHLGGVRLTTGTGPAGIERLLDDLAKFDPSDSPERKLAAVAGGADSVISIGTDAAPIAAGRSVVLRLDGFGGRRASDPPERGSWIEVDSPDDVAGQVLSGWRLGVRRGGRVG